MLWIVLEKTCGEKRAPKYKKIDFNLFECKEQGEYTKKKSHVTKAQQEREQLRGEGSATKSFCVIARHSCSMFKVECTFF